MPDVPDWLLPVVMLVLGYLSKTLEGWATHKQTVTREREGRDAARQERRDAFQRETLLDLQEAAQSLGHAAGEIHVFEALANPLGAQNYTTAPRERYEQFREGQAKTGLLGARVRDEAVRAALVDFKQCAATAALHGINRIVATQAFDRLVTLSDTLNERIGTVLRGLDV